MAQNCREIFRINLSVGEEIVQAWAKSQKDRAREWNWTIRTGES
jgi:hypothetical protein